jgi:uncharacterized protein (AIM24 family)
MAGSRQLWLALAGSGWLWVALEEHQAGRAWKSTRLAALIRAYGELALTREYGCLWLALAGSGCLWLALGGSGWLWVALAGSGGAPGWLWLALGGSGWLWVSGSGWSQDIACAGPAGF